VTALLVTLGAFAFWGLTGVACLALVRADTTSLRVVLTAPMLGTCVTVLPLFICSEAGLGLASCAVPLGLVLLVGAIATLLVLRPRVHPGAAAVAGTCVALLPLVAWPMSSLGFGWLANGNEDMTNYVLSAQDLLHHGLLSSMDFRGLTQGRDYATVLASLHIAGARPGCELLLAFVSRVTSRPTYQTFMPVIVAFNLCGASAVGALALQATRRWWAAVLASGLLLISPLASYGVLQQLLGQVLGLGLVAALCALLMRPELHAERGPRASQVIPIALLSAGLVLGYPELIPEVGLAYLAFLAVLIARRQITPSATARLWVPTIAIVVIVLNSYFFTELRFLINQSTHGLSAAAYPPLFGYVLVPSALPGIFGLQVVPPGPDVANLDLTIVLAIVGIAVVILAAVASARRGGAAALILLAQVLLGTLLVLKNSDFGVFKLTMYVQPFLAALIAVQLANTRRWALAVIGAVVLVAMVAAQLSSQHAYVTASRDPTNVPHLSARDVIPAFHATAVSAARPVVSVTENPVLIKLEAASSEGHPVYFQSRNAFLGLIHIYADEVSGQRRAQAEAFLHNGPWVLRSFRLLDSKGSTDEFEDDTRASAALSSGQCELVIPSGNELPFNRLSLSGSVPNLVRMGCGAPHDLLAFTSSDLGESFYLPTKRKHVSFFQLEGDPFFAGLTIAGFGRYAMFRVLAASKGTRLELSLTDTLTHNGVNRLPPAVVIGAGRVPLPLEGRGSARVFSPPLTPQIIGGAPYLLLDMGAEGQLPPFGAHGVQGLYGRSVPTDPRFLTSYLRDVSLVSSAEYAHMHPPAAVSSFPSDLANDKLEYSGIYEDGWVAERSYVRLARGPRADLVLRCEVPGGAGKHLQILVSGRTVASLPISPGALDVRVPVPASATDRRVELRFAATVPLKSPDLRPAAALLSYLGFMAPAAKR
jgi:hypothetical protein